ncbi:Lrp/AsnC family transcriptional regulator [Methylobrevis albus]|uniref:Lrp/AsnC family transcriptional regulator n=1 Tax=Methylobrevis albus TaxID=2793297 RepID=A0A931HZ09_9HYPH|nr:Lrp/AsnC family transcriptional regulator [Methylobrevis albus]MBH0237362.1 Lrp/AsnC family transcriptional regulator [Methylobrevis albus]
MTKPKHAVRAVDAIDTRILTILDAEARISLSELAGRIGLSAPSTSDRLRRLVDAGVIHAFTIEIDPEALGYPIRALVRVRPLPGRLRIVQKMIEDLPYVVECDKVTGDEAFLARLYARSIPHLDEMLEALADDAVTHTTIIKGSPVRRRLPPLG